MIMSPLFYCMYARYCLEKQQQQCDLSSSLWEKCLGHGEGDLKWIINQFNRCTALGEKGKKDNP